MNRLHALSVAALCATTLPLAAQTIERMRLTDGELSCTQIFAEVQQMDTMIKLAGNAPRPNPAPVPAAGAAAAASPIDGIAGSLAGLLGGAMGQPGAAVPDSLMPNQAGLPPALLADPKVQASVARARAAGYSDAQIAATMQLGAARAGYPVGAAFAANGQRPLSAAAGGNNEQIARNIAAQGQAYAGNVAAGQNWQNALANAQGATAVAPAPAPAASPLGGLFGALAARGGNVGGAQAAGLFGALAAGQQQATAPAPAPVAVAAAPAAQSGQVAAQAQARKEHLTSLFLGKGCKMSDVQR